MDTAAVKALNKRILRARLTLKRKATIQELSGLTHLSVVTVKTLLNEMMVEGEVYEGEMVPSGGGRPSMQYICNGDNRYAVVIFGHQKESKNLISLMVINLFGECVWQEQIFIDDIQIESFEGMIDRAVGRFPKTAALAFGLPGFEANGNIVANDYSGLIGERFLNYYKTRYNLPIAYINDVNAAVKGYSISAPSESCAVGIYFPRIYRPGAGVVIRGEVYEGAQHFAGEIGHLLPDIDWLKLNYSDETAVVDAVSSLLCIYCRILAPDRFILYGDFFREGVDTSIQQSTENMLSGQFHVNIAASKDLESDFARGMKAVALKQLSDTFN